MRFSPATRRGSFSSASTFARLPDLRRRDRDGRIVAMMLPRIMQPDVAAFLE